MASRSLASILLSWHLLWRWLLAFLLPYFLFSIVTSLASGGINEALGQLPPPRVGVVQPDSLPGNLYNDLKADAEVVTLPDATAAQLQVETDSLDVALVVEKLGAKPYTGQITVYYNSMRHLRAVRQINDLLKEYEQRLLMRNLQALELNERLAKPLAIEREDTFSPLLMLGEMVENAKGGISNIFNFLMILLVSWLARQLMLRLALYAPKAFWRNLLVAVLGTTLGALLVFWGVQVGLDFEPMGLVRRLVISIQKLIVVDRLWPILLLWVPTWLFVLGVLGSLTSGSRLMISAYGRTFWLVVGLHALALFGFKSAVGLKAWMLWVPIFNLFQLGQLRLQGTLEMTDWTVAMVGTTVWALLFLGLWGYLMQRQTAQTLSNES